MSSTGDDDPLLTIADVAGLLKIPVGSLRQWRVRGYGPAGFLVGKHLRFRRRDVQLWIDDQAEG